MSHSITWCIAILSVAGVIIRPFKWPEAVWAVSGAVLLIVLGLITPSEGWTGILKGLDVYLFLTGMMLLAESAREEKLFDWLAAWATRFARGSANTLFLLIYLTGVVVTVFLSNDATAVVLTPAVAAAMKTAKAEKPLPYLLICAFVANAASFVLPISNPANLVLYGAHIPPLLQWLSQYLLPSIVCIVVTFFMLRLTQRKKLHQKIETHIPVPLLSTSGKTALYGIGGTALVLLAASAKNIPLGLPTFITGIITSAIVIIRAGKNPAVILKGVAWQILPLVAGLFVITAALNTTGLLQTLTHAINNSAAHSVTTTVWGSGVITAVACNVMNNLPAGLIAGNVIQMAHLPEIVKSAVVIGVDVGPNLSVTGSLATILWLAALRREGITISGGAFLKTGILVMTVALAAAIACVWI